jgi:hypothetical protein
VVIHAIGILLCLPHILESDERFASLSLGAAKSRNIGAGRRLVIG